MKTMKWEIIESDIDYQILQKRFNGLLTKKRIKIINRYIRRNSGQYPYCGCTYDCCGCPSSRYSEVNYNKGHLYYTITVTKKIYFNY